MSCGDPIKCHFWDGKRCAIPSVSFQYCRSHQEKVDEWIHEELTDAIDREDWEKVKEIRKSPFKSW